MPNPSDDLFGNSAVDSRIDGERLTLNLGKCSLEDPHPPLVTQQLAGGTILTGAAGATFEARCDFSAARLGHLAATTHYQGALPALVRVHFAASRMSLPAVDPWRAVASLVSDRLQSVRQARLPVPAGWRVVSLLRAYEAGGAAWLLDPAVDAAMPARVVLERPGGERLTALWSPYAITVSTGLKDRGISLSGEALPAGGAIDLSDQLAKLV